MRNIIQKTPENQKPVMLRHLLMHGIQFSQLSKLNQNLPLEDRMGIVNPFYMKISILLPQAIPVIADLSKCPKKTYADLCTPPVILDQPVWIENGNFGACWIARQKDQEFKTNIFCFYRCPSNQKISHVGVLNYHQHQSGRLSNLNCESGYLLDHRSTHENVSCYVDLFCALNEMLTCKNIYIMPCDETTVKVHPCLRKKKRVKQKNLAFYYLVVTPNKLLKKIKTPPNNKILPIELHKEVRIMRRQHIFRGSLKTYTDAAPRFGDPAQAGTFWHNGGVRGDDTRGTVKKGYIIK